MLRIEQTYFVLGGTLLPFPKRDGSLHKVHFWDQGPKVENNYKNSKNQEEY